MKQVRSILSLILVLSMIMVLAACGGTTTDTTAGTSAGTTTGTTAAVDPGAPVYGGDITVYYQEFYSEYDPAVYTNRNYVAFYYDMLWNLDWETDRNEFNFTGSFLASDYLTGQIADSWEAADDSTSMTVKLRQDVYFQDKTAVGMDAKYNVYDARNLVAADVKWTYDRLLGLDGATKVAPNETDWPATLYMLKSVEVVDDYTVKFNFNTNSKTAIGDFMCARVNIGGSEWDKLDEAQKADWHYAVGTGPFVITDYVPDNSMVLTANPKYWQKDTKGNKLPYLDTVTIVQFSDKTNVLSQFIAGKLDIYSFPSRTFDNDQVVQLKAGMTDDQYVEYQYYGTPMAIGLKQGSAGVKALSDIKVRMAMQYALDLSAIETGFFQRDISNGIKISGIWATDTIFNDPASWSDELTASYITYDPEKAKALLAEAGYADGFEFDCTIFSMLPAPLFQIVGEQLKAVGITMNLVVGNTPPDMTSVGADATNPSSVFFNVRANSPTAASYGIGKDSPQNFVHNNDTEIESMLTDLLAAQTLDEQITLAKALDQYYMSQHYLLYISGCETYSNWYNSRIQGLHGEAITPNYYMGYTLARTWVTDAAK